MKTELVRGQVYTAEDGRRYVILQTGGETFILAANEAVEFAEHLVKKYGEDAPGIAHFHHLTARALNGGAVS